MTTYTEEEAAGKWCFMYRATFSAGYEAADLHDNRPEDSEGKLHPSCRCIGSACMAWRWFDDPASTDAGLTWRDQSYPKWAGARLQAESSAGAERVPRRGYCGASRP